LKGPRAIVRAAGFDVVRYAPPSMGAVDARRLAAIRGSNVAAVLDVGAAGGDFGRKLRASGYDGEIVSFEPLTSSFLALKETAAADGRWYAIQIAVGDREGAADINVSGTAVSSSLLPMEPLHVETIPASRYEGREKVRVRALDALVAELPQRLRGGPFYLKVDVQGYEAQVLDGAADTLARVAAIELEVSLRPLYRGSALFRDMLMRLETLGFTLVSWEDVLSDPRTGFVLQADCIFVGYNQRFLPV
jgi:FkbM family methyltransferase